MENMKILFILGFFIVIANAIKTKERHLDSRDSNLKTDSLDIHWSDGIWGNIFGLLVGMISGSVAPTSTMVS